MARFDGYRERIPAELFDTFDETKTPAGRIFFFRGGTTNQTNVPSSGVGYLTSDSSFVILGGNVIFSSERGSSTPEGLRLQHLLAQMPIELVLGMKIYGPYPLVPVKALETETPETLAISDKGVFTFMAKPDLEDSADAPMPPEDSSLFDDAEAEVDVEAAAAAAMALLGSHAVYAEGLCLPARQGFSAAFDCSADFWAAWDAIEGKKFIRLVLQGILTRDVQ